MSERTAKEQFIMDLVDNEKRLAEAIVNGTADEEISSTMGFDQMQIDTMKKKLASFDEKPEEEKTEPADDAATPADDSEKSAGESEEVNEQTSDDSPADEPAATADAAAVETEPSGDGEAPAEPENTASSDDATVEPSSSEGEATDSAPSEEPTEEVEKTS